VLRRLDLGAEHADSSGWGTAIRRGVPANGNAHANTHAKPYAYAYGDTNAYSVTHANGGRAYGDG